MSEKIRILHVEDDPAWMDDLLFFAQTDGTEYQITVCATIEEVLKLLHKGRNFEAAIVDLTIDRGGSEWTIKTPEDLVLHLKQFMGVAILSGIPTPAIIELKKKLDVPIFNKALTEDFDKVVRAALANFRPSE